MKFSAFLLLVCLAILVSCHDRADVICDEIQTGLVTYDLAKVQEFLQPWLDELPPRNGYYDSSEHGENLHVFQNRLNEVCDLNALVLCHACIETLPPQSEIRIGVDSSGHEIFRVIDLLTPEDDVMTIRAIHN